MRKLRFYCKVISAASDAYRYPFRGTKMNIPSVLKLVVAVFFLATLPAQVHALTPDQVFDKVKDSIVVVKTLDTQGKVKVQGSGVLLPSGKIATNSHVVEGGTSYQVGRGEHFISATLYAEDEDKDICLLEAKDISGKPAQLGKAANLKVGVPVYAVGAPMGLELSLSDGIVAQLRGDPPPLIQTTAAISPGSSGGGLFDSEGRLVGLTTLYIEGGQSLNFAMPVEWISEIKPGRKQAIKGPSQIAWLKRASALEEVKDWQGMLDWCLKWTKSEPENAHAWFNLGYAFLKLERYNDAIDAYRENLRINPESASAWYLLGNTYFNLKRYNDSIDAYHQVLRINPDYASAWLGLGSVFSGLKRYEDTIDAYRQALRINPDDASAWYFLGNAYLSLKRYEETIDACRQALRINPDDANAWFCLGVAYSGLKRYNDSVDTYRQALRINPDDANAWFGLGGAYYFSGNRTAAMDTVKELHRLDPTLSDELFNLIVPR